MAQAETGFLSAVELYLRSVRLSPAPALFGIAEPEKDADLPAVVLSLEATERAGSGLGERTTLISDGVLPWAASIALANPVLPEEPTFRLLNDARTVLILPHGGLVKNDGSTGPLDGTDITVKVGGVSRPVVAGTPTGNQVRADPMIGTLTFSTPLPTTGMVDATYFLGQWEQRIARIVGTLRIDACAAPAANASDLSTAVVEAMLAPKAKSDIQRLLAISLAGLSSVGAKEQGPNVRRRTARFTFSFEQQVNRPESSGGIIGRIPITTELGVATVDKASGAISTTVTTVSG